MGLSETETLRQRLRRNLDKVWEEIAAAADTVGRSSSEITLVAVSKNQPLDFVRAIVSLGVTDIGENRVQELLTKTGEFSKANLRWHMVGHLQRNKVKYIVGVVELIQSVDSLPLAREIDRRASEVGVCQSLLVEVNVSGEASKYGVAPRETGRLFSSLMELSHVEVKGLMTMAPLGCSEAEARRVFSGLRELRDSLRREFPEANLECLSMGMSDDFPEAIKEGSNMVRIGRSLFR